MNLEGLTVIELRQICRENKILFKGKKKFLIAQIKDHTKKEKRRKKKEEIDRKEREELEKKSKNWPGSLGSLPYIKATSIEQSKLPQSDTNFFVQVLAVNSSYEYIDDMKQDDNHVTILLSDGKQYIDEKIYITPDKFAKKKLTKGTILKYQNPYNFDIVGYCSKIIGKPEHYNLTNMKCNFIRNECIFFHHIMNDEYDEKEINEQLDDISKKEISKQFDDISKFRYDREHWSAYSIYRSSIGVAKQLLLLNNSLDSYDQKVDWIIEQFDRNGVFRGQVGELCFGSTTIIPFMFRLLKNNNIDDTFKTYLFGYINECAIHSSCLLKKHQFERQLLFEEEKIKYKGKKPITKQFFMYDTILEAINYSTEYLMQSITYLPFSNKITNDVTDYFNNFVNCYDEMVIICILSHLNLNIKQILQLYEIYEQSFDIIKKSCLLFCISMNVNRLEEDMQIKKELLCTMYDEEKHPICRLAILCGLEESNFVLYIDIIKCIQPNIRKHFEFKFDTDDIISIEEVNSTKIYTSLNFGGDEISCIDFYNINEYKIGSLFHLFPWTHNYYSYLYKASSITTHMWYMTTCTNQHDMVPFDKDYYKKLYKKYTIFQENYNLSDVCDKLYDLDKDIVMCKPN